MDQQESQISSPMLLHLLKMDWKEGRTKADSSFFVNGSSNRNKKRKYDRKKMELSVVLCKQKGCKGNKQQCNQTYSKSRSFSHQKSTLELVAFAYNECIVVPHF